MRRTECVQKRSANRGGFEMKTLFRDSMKGNFMDPRSPSKISTLILLCISLAAPAVAVAGKGPETNKERELIQVLQSGAPPEAKAVTCKKLAVYGTKDAVPALAALLSDEQLASWSRIALEAIPGSAPDKALRDAAPKLQGRLLIGVINSI